MRMLSVRVKLDKRRRVMKDLRVSWPWEIERGGVVLGGKDFEEGEERRFVRSPVTFEPRDDPRDDVRLVGDD